jgi:hypothetical protein
LPFCSPGIGQFLQGFLPGLALKLFLMFLPRILMLMSKIEGHISQSQLERVAAGKLFVFLVRLVVPQIVWLAKQTRNMPVGLAYFCGIEGGGPDCEYRMTGKQKRVAMRQLVFWWFSCFSE